MVTKIEMGVDQGSRSRRNVRRRDSTSHCLRALRRRPVRRSTGARALRAKKFSSATPASAFWRKARCEIWSASCSSSCAWSSRFALGDPIGDVPDDQDHALDVPIDRESHRRFDPAPAPVGMTQAVLRHVLPAFAAQPGKRGAAARDVRPDA
jgi:hypothetical protein